MIHFNGYSLWYLVKKNEEGGGCTFERLVLSDV